MANGAHPLGIHAAAAPPSPSASSTFARHQQHHQQQQQHHQQQQQQQHHQLLQQHQQHQLLQHRLQQQQHHLQQQQGLFLHQIAGSPGGGAAVAGMDQAMATATSEGESLDARSPDADRAESTVREGEGAGSAGGGGGASGPAGGVGAGKAIGAASGGGGSGGGGAGAGPGPGATAGRGKQKDSFADWSNGAIHSLLDAFTEKNEELNGRNLRGRDWEEVTSAVNARGDGSKPVKSVLQCRNKLDNLKKRHKIEKDKMFTTGNLKTKWQWFVKMDAIVGRTAKQPRPGPSVPASLALAIAEEIPRLPSSSSPQATTGAGASTQTPATAAAAAASLSLQHQQQQPTPSSSDPKKKARKKMKLTTSQLLQHDAELADVAAVISGDIEFPGMSTRPPGMDDYSRTVPQNPYAKVTEPTLQAGHLRDLPGFTRSVYEREYALIAPESQVYSPLPGWMNTLGAYLITPAIGSHFSMYLAQMKGNSTSAPPLVDVERFIFVVKGELQLSTSSNEGYNMHVDWFAYLPPNMQHSLKSAYSATIVVFERRYIKDVIEQDGPKLIVGITDKLPVLETPGEVFALRKLLPTSSIYDFNIHVMDFQPGEFLNVKEVHYFQHGLLLLEGRGIYRLGDKWHPVQAGDVIWMAPFVPQWYAALGRTRSRYLLYKDVNRDPLLHPY